MRRTRPQLTLGQLRKFTRGWKDSTPLVVAESLVNMYEPQATQEFIDEINHKVVSMDDAGKRTKLRIGYIS